MERNHICKKCGGIAGWDSYFQSWICTRCGDFERKPITNGDRIRAMNDEKLAEFLQKNRGGCRALTTESYVCDFYTEDLNTDCNACWLDWLKQEGKNNE